MSPEFAQAGAALNLVSDSEAATQTIGARLIRLILPLLAQRSRAFVLGLAGPLGAGKTTLARGLLAELGVAGPVRSPSYALMECYDTAGCQVVHIDLYRMGSAEEVAGLGLRDFDVPSSLWLVEWPERAATHLPMPDLSLRLSIGAANHRLQLTAGSADGARVLDGLASHT